MNIPLVCAFVGLAFEIAGLLVLLSPDAKESFEKQMNRGVDGLENWQQDVTNIVNDQRRKQIISGILIVIGICLQTFPEYLN